jgi:hypothetical protein
LPSPGESRFLSGLAPLRNDNLVGEMTKPTLIIGTEGETPSGQPGDAGATLLFPLLSCPLRFAFQGALEGLVQGGLRAFVFLLADAALFVFDLELEEFFFQAFEQHGG